MQKLNRANIKALELPEGVQVGNFAKMPEKVLQFGEGNFLRAFVEWHFQQLTNAGKFDGSIVVAQPIAQGMAQMLNEQDCLYTCMLRGIQNGQLVEKYEVITNISRALDSYSQWSELVKLAESEDLEYVVSNTTEAGIVFDGNDRLDMAPPNSYPGKLAALLYARYKKFDAAQDKGLVIIPCELIEHNGKTLKKVVLQLAELWNLPAAFSQWIESANTFVSTLVDRVVTGYPKDEIEAIWSKLGYRDDLVVAGEIFHLWVLEGPQTLANRLQFQQIGLNVVWTDDQSKYRDRKVRILNGAHTTGIPVSYQYGLDTVLEMMNDDITGRFVTGAIYEEIIPSMNDDIQALTDLADEVVNRFKNPYIKHYLLSILLNSSSKYRARVLPSVLGYSDKHGKLPKRLVFSLACLLNVYSLGVIDGSVLKCKRGDEVFEMRDDLSTLQLFVGIWQEYEQSGDLLKTARAMLAADNVWGMNLNSISGMTEAVAGYLQAIKNSSVQEVLKGL